MVSKQQLVQVELQAPPVVVRSRGSVSSEAPEARSPREILIADGRFALTRKIGSGSFGKVYQGGDKCNGADVAIKLEPIQAHPQQIHNEVRILKAIGKLEKRAAGFTTIHWNGVEGEFNVLVIDYVGPCLGTLLAYCSGKFTLKTVLMLADQMLRRLKTLHSVLYIHRDIKPDNFTLGRGRFGHHVYLIDFGLSKRYWDPKADAHVPYRDGRPLVGTMRYVSVATHLGIEPARRDDLESLGYVLLYFSRGSLPWMGIQGDGPEKVAKIGAVKESTSVSVLCRGEHGIFKKWFTYAKTMKYEEQPDYGALRRWVQRAMDENGWEYDWQFDWVVRRRKRLELHRRSSRRSNTSDISDRNSSCLSRRESTATSEDAGRMLARSCSMSSRSSLSSVSTSPKNRAAVRKKRGSRYQGETPPLPDHRDQADEMGDVSCLVEEYAGGC
eukprot:TRINITY_DN4351_c0_g1_i1.p1 TRINITY_DN4351_c0_g1~~TRINITY_DN4351_c0_g1_i1.p1  ORF type:complete len:469 (+),score=88.91 TRINITY_DN4351_c0_g1_i1:86-1408(+)